MAQDWFNGSFEVCDASDGIAAEDLSLHGTLRLIFDQEAPSANCDGDELFVEMSDNNSGPVNTEACLAKLPQEDTPVGEFELLLELAAPTDRFHAIALRVLSTPSGTGLLSGVFYRTDAEEGEDTCTRAVFAPLDRENYPSISY